MNLAEHIGEILKRADLADRERQSLLKLLVELHESGQHHHDTSQKQAQDQLAALGYGIKSEKVIRLEKKG